MKKISIMLVMMVLISNMVIDVFAITEATDKISNSKITKEQLKEQFQQLKEYMNSDDDESSKIENIAVNDKSIEVTTDKNKYEMNYEIQDNKVVFSSETEIKQGMSYEEYQRNTKDIDNVFWGYLAVANILGIKYEDSVMYCAFAKLSGTSGTLDTSDSYTIYTPAPGVTLENPDDKIIISTEFGNRTMEYFNSVYKEDKHTYNDSEQYNTFECVVEKKEKKDTSCKLSETLTINTEADFSKISGISNSFLDNGVTKENADYVYNMKIGQKLKFETNEKFSEYQSVGEGVENSENEKELVATKKGTTKGYITFGSTKKSFYITVEENINNEQLEDIIVKIDSDESKTENSNDKIENNTNDVKSNEKQTANISVMPKTGREQNIVLIILYILIAIAIIGIVSLIFSGKRINKK